MARGRKRKEPAVRAARVREALARLGGDATVRAVALEAGLPLTTTFRILRDIGADLPVHAASAQVAPPEPARVAPSVLVVGLGGAGGRVVRRLHEIGFAGAATLVVDSDRIDVERAVADTKLLVGKTQARGAGAGGDPALGARCAEAAAPALESLVAGARLVLVVGGLGAGTGTGAAPVVARLARAAGALVVCVMSLPFRIERARRTKAEAGVAPLAAEAHTLVALDADRLLAYAPNLPMDQAFRVLDTLVAETIKGMVETSTRPALIGLDPGDARAVLERGGLALLHYGEARASEPDALVREALQHPFLDAEAEGAAGALVELVGGPELSLAGAKRVADALAARLGPGAPLAWGARVAPQLAGRLRLTVVLTGVKARTP